MVNLLLSCAVKINSNLLVSNFLSKSRNAQIMLSFGLATFYTILLSSKWELIMEEGKAGWGLNCGGENNKSCLYFLFCIFPTFQIRFVYISFFCIFSFSFWPHLSFSFFWPFLSLFCSFLKSFHFASLFVGNISHWPASSKWELIMEKAEGACA